MSQLLIKQRVFSWTDTYDVYDEFENPVYFVKAEFLTLGHQIHVYDRFDNEVAVIHQRLLTLLPAFDIEMHGQTIGTIRREFSFFQPRYTIDYSGWDVHGDFLGWDYDISVECNLIAHISKEIFHWGDTYVLDIPNKEDELNVLLLAIAIDAANCDNN